ncbi:UNVERIFIED_CONTAM: hypothetical protein K2H54_071853 [Gekko kuhli]
MAHEFGSRCSNPGSLTATFQSTADREQCQQGRFTMVSSVRCASPHGQEEGGIVVWRGQRARIEGFLAFGSLPTLVQPTALTCVNELSKHKAKTF